VNRALLAAVGLLLSSAVSAGSPQPDDPYRWLEDGDDPEVVAWL
jgi:hypothetical protein